MLGDDIILTVCDIKGNKVILGLDAPKEINIVREELLPPHRKEEILGKYVRKEKVGGKV